MDWSSDFDLAATATDMIEDVCANTSSPVTCGGVSIDLHKVGPPDIQWKLSAAVNFAVFHGGALHSSTFNINLRHPSCGVLSLKPHPTHHTKNAQAELKNGGVHGRIRRRRVHQVHPQGGAVQVDLALTPD